MIYLPVKYHITKYHDMYNNGDYGASFHYVYIQSHHTLGQYQGTSSYVMAYCQHYIVHTVQRDKGTHMLIPVLYTNLKVAVNQ